MTRKRSTIFIHYYFTRSNFAFILQNILFVDVSKLDDIITLNLNILFNQLINSVLYILFDLCKQGVYITYSYMISATSHISFIPVLFFYANRKFLVVYIIVDRYLCFESVVHSNTYENLMTIFTTIPS